MLQALLSGFLHLFESPFQFLVFLPEFAKSLALHEPDSNSVGQNPRGIQLTGIEVAASLSHVFEFEPRKFEVSGPPFLLHVEPIAEPQGFF